MTELQALLDPSIPDGDVAKILARAVTALLEQVRMRKIGSCSSPRSPQASTRSDARSKTPSRHIPAAIRREVWARDGGRCTYVSPQGRQCGAVPESFWSFIIRYRGRIVGSTLPPISICAVAPTINTKPSWPLVASIWRPTERAHPRVGSWKKPSLRHGVVMNRDRICIPFERHWRIHEPGLGVLILGCECLGESEDRHLSRVELVTIVALRCRDEGS